LGNSNSDIYEVVGRINVQTEYDIKNYEDKGYLFKPSFTGGWSMKDAFERQLESERTKAKPSKTLTIKQLIRKDKWWKIF
jgi:hypothetical protein